MADPQTDERLKKALAKAEQLFKAGSLNELIAWCNKIVAVYPGQPDALGYVAKAQAQLNERLIEDIFAMVQKEEDQGDYEMALNHLERVFKIDAQHALGLEKKAYLQALLQGEAPGVGSGDALPDPEDFLKDVEGGSFGIDADDPFSLEGEAPPPVSPALKAPPPVFEDFGDTGGGAEVDTDMSGVLVNSENMHEAAAEFGVKVEHGAAGAASEGESFELDSGQEFSGADDDAGGAEDMSAFEIAGRSDEESEAGGSSAETFELPGEEPAAAAAQTFELPDEEPAPPPASAKILSAEEQKHVQDLLKKGHSYFERGQCQLAIDAWYQILLVDENHKEALQLIARAKQELEMQGKKINLDIPSPAQEASEGEPSEVDVKETIRTLAVEAKLLFDTGKYKEAIEKADRILQLEPAHQEANRVTHEANLKLQAIAKRVEAMDAGAAAAAAPKRVYSAKPPEIVIAAPPKSRLPWIILGAVLLLLMVGVGAGWMFMSVLKPSSGTPPAPAAMPAKPQPQAPPQVQAPQPQAPAVTPEELAAKAQKEADDLYALCRKFYSEKHYIEALGALTECLKVLPSHAQALAFKEQATITAKAFKEEQDRWQQAMKAYETRNYEESLRLLYRMREPKWFGPELQEAANRQWYTLTTSPADIQRYVENSWFNSAILALQGGNLPQANNSLDEYLKENPKDAEAKKLKDFAKRYSTLPKDAAYEAFVGGLTLRE